MVNYTNVSVPSFFSMKNFFDREKSMLNLLYVEISYRKKQSTMFVATTSEYEKSNKIHLFFDLITYLILFLWMNESSSIGTSKSIWPQISLDK
jgi:hypothetical protein